jgi:hypothetical protein
MAFRIWTVQVFQRILLDGFLDLGYETGGFSGILARLTGTWTLKQGFPLDFGS